MDRLHHPGFNHHAPPPAAALYVGKVMHARLKPMGHRFNYRVMSLLIDLDRLGDADRQSLLFGVNRAALYSFHEADHGDRNGLSLRQYAQHCAREHDIDLAGGRVLLLCYPRLFGYTFNPLSVYFCSDAGGRLVLMIYEVRNTFGDIHAYVLPVEPENESAAGIRQQQDKQFYVSPFVEMAMRYHFRVSPPSDTVRLRILETDHDGPLLAATFHGDRRPLTTRALLRSVVSLPFVTFKIIAAIHWEALRLWIKGARLVPREPAADGSGTARSATRDAATAHAVPGYQEPRTQSHFESMDLRNARADRSHAGQHRQNTSGSSPADTAGLRIRIAAAARDAGRHSA